MRIVKASLFMLLMQISFAETSNSELENINQLRWENRIVVVYSQSTPEEIVALLSSRVTDIDDRDIYWFVLDNKQLYTNYIGNVDASFYQITREKYFPHQEAEIKLIGKDGYVKASYKTLDLNVIFALIDTMPMRQMEMHQQ